MPKPPAITRVLMVCLGNICRSPSAQGILEAKLKQQGLSGSVEVDSAGTYGGHAGEPPDPRAVSACAERYYNIQSQTARKIHYRDFETFDYILAMDNDNLTALQDCCPPKYQRKLHLLMEYASGKYQHSEVPDPYYGGTQGFHNVIHMIELACDGFIAQLPHKHRASHSAKRAGL